MTKQAELDALLSEIEADRVGRIVREFPVRVARERLRLRLEREVAAENEDEYADELPLSAPIGDEWYLASSGVNPTLVCGNVAENSVSLFCFTGTGEFHLSGLCDGLDISPLKGKGLGAYGLFAVRNSRWKARVLEAMASGLPSYDADAWCSLEHFVVRGKGGELVCLARAVEQRSLSQSIVSVREILGSSRILALLDSLVGCK
jgi:hypothetical protein